MSDLIPEPGTEEPAADDVIAGAHTTIAAARAEAEAAAAQGAEHGIVAAVTQAVPNIVCTVKPGNVVGHGGVSYGYDAHDGSMLPDGDTVELDGPSAIALIQLGHVVPKAA